MDQLVIRNLTISFGGIMALSSVDFSVKQGEIFAIIGPNGAGKTTIFNCINRIYTPDRGAIEFKARNLLKEKISGVSRLAFPEPFRI